MRRFLRYCRAPFSAVCGGAAVLFVVFWARSYWWTSFISEAVDDPTAPFTSQTFMISSSLGKLRIGSFPTPFWPHTYGWQCGTAPLDDSALNWDRRMNRSEFRWQKSQTGYSVQLPYWFLTLVFAVFGVAPWVTSFRRFSLRTMLCATTALAAVLGLTAYVLQHQNQWTEVARQQDAQARREEAERQRLKAIKEAESERLYKIMFKEVAELEEDLKKIKETIGRWPKDEAELLELRGKPMPLTRLRDGTPIAIEYIRDESDPAYRLVYRW